MWCYQRPGFEAHLVTELQKQQQRSQFCDTLLKAEGVSVPAHSCILSAFSSHLSSVMSSTPAPPAGQRRVVEFRALGACTLLHMMRLLYSGEMVGEGEEERQEAISTAAKLGIHGLVEVSKKGYQVQNGERGGQCVDVGVQTESLLYEESGARRGKWRRQVRDGYTLLWKDTVPNGEKDTWTQTDEVQGGTAHTTGPAGSFEAVSMAALKSFGHSELHFCPAQVPRVPIAVIHARNENQISALQSLSSVPAASLGESTAAGCRSFVLGQPCSSVPPTFEVSHVSTAGSSQTFLCAGDLQHCWADPQETVAHVAAEREGETYEQFQGNIPGFITYFVDKGNGSRRRRAGRRRGAGVLRARRGYTGARRPRGGRGTGLTQTVDVQKVGVSVFHRKWVQRWTVQALRTGQGGGATGRKLHLQTRDLLRSPKTCQSRRLHSKVWEVSEAGEVLLQSKRGRGRGKKSNTAEQQVGRPVGRRRRGRAKSAASDSCVFTPITFYNSHTSDSQLTQPSTSVSMLSCPTTLVTPASALLHTTQLPPLTTPPNENHHETFECLLEEVLLGLNLDAAAPRCHPPPTAGGSSCIFSSPARSSHQEHCSTEGVTGGKEGTGFSSANSEEQQQGEGQISDILDSFLQSFEKHVETCNAREEAMTHWQSGTEGSQLQPVLSQSQAPHPENTVQHTQPPSVCRYAHSEIRHSQTSPQVDSVSAVLPFIHSDDHCPEQASISRPTEPLDNGDVSPEATMSQSPLETVPVQSPGTREQPDSPAKAKQVNSRQTACVKSVEEQRTRKKTPVSLKAPVTKITNDPKDEQRQQIPEGKRHENEPAQDTQVTLQSPVKTNTSSSSLTCPHDSERNQQPVPYVKTFSPKTKKVQMLPHSRETPLCQPVCSSQDASTQLAQPTNQSLTEITECKLKSKSGRSPQNGHLYLAVSESLIVPIQQQPVESCSRDNQVISRGRHEKQEESGKACEEQEKNKGIHEEQEKNKGIHEEQEKNKGIHEQKKNKGIHEQKKNKGIHEEQEKNKGIHEQEKNQEVDEDQDNTQETGEENQGTCEELTVLSQEQPKGSTRVAGKRQMDAVEERSTDATAVKRICIDQISQPAAEASVSTCVCSLSLTEEEIYMEAADVETNEGDVSQRNTDPKQELNVYLTDEDLENSSDLIADVDGNWDDSSFPRKIKDDPSQISSSREAAEAHCGQMNPLVLLHSHSQTEDLNLLGSLKDETEEYIDVIEGGGPVPDLARISWMDSSGCEEEEGDEEIDVVGPVTEYASSSLVLFSML